MAIIMNVHEAKTHFLRLLERAHQGEEIVVAKAGTLRKAGAFGRTQGAYSGYCQGPGNRRVL